MSLDFLSENALVDRSATTFPLPRSTEDQAAAIGSAARALDTFRQGWLNPDTVDPVILKGRTLTELYNQRPTWLAQAHERLDRAVLAAYGWPLDASDDDIVAALLALNLQREPVT